MTVGSGEGGVVGGVKLPSDVGLWLPREVGLDCVVSLNTLGPVIEELELDSGHED